MGLFEQIINAIDNPTTEGSKQQLGDILGAVSSAAASRGIDNNQTQQLTSVVGNFVRQALQQKRTNEGSQGVDEIINNYGGLGGNIGALSALFNRQQQEDMIQVAAQKTGLNPDMIRSLLPLLVPAVLYLLRAGRSQTANAPGQAPNNSVLSSFLDTDNDGDVDVGDALSMATRFFNR